MDILRWTAVLQLLLEIPLGVLAFVDLSEFEYPEVVHDTPIPEFMPTPSNVTFHLGELAILQCRVLNLGMRTVVWRKTDVTFPLTSGTLTVISDSRFQISHVSYNNQWDLMIKNVQFDDEGLYECQVASVDRTVRKVISLTVIGKEELPEIHISEPQYMERREVIHLQCNTTGEYYAPTFVHFHPEEELPVIHISEPQYVERGEVIHLQYSVTPRGILRSHYLTYPEEELPEIHISEPQYVERGEVIHLQCNATGEYYAPDEMDWFRNGERLTSRRNAGVKIFKSYSIAKRTFFSELKIQRASMLDDGTYVCRSSNNQITSTKVHVLNAETFNKKRGTLDGEVEKSSYVKQRDLGSSAAAASHDVLYFLGVALTFFVIRL